MTQASPKKSKSDASLIIRLATKSDVPQIIETQLKSLEILAAKDYYPYQLRALLASKNCPRSRWEIIFVAEIKSQIVGFAALDRFTNSLTGLYVNPEYTRQGIGTKLLQKVEQAAIKYKIPILWVCASLTGYPFYLANNYQKLQQTVILLDGTFIPCIQMKKRLLTPTKTEQIKDILYHALILFLIVWLLILMIAKF